MPRKVVFTKEEKEEDIKDVEIMLRSNLNCPKITIELGRSVQYIYNIRDYLNENGILTKDELEIINLAKIDEENRLFDEQILELKKAGKSNRKICEILRTNNKKVNEACNRLSANIDLSVYLTEEEMLKQERLAKIKEFVNDGTGVKYPTQIAKATNIPTATVIRMLEILINDGSISRENIIIKRSFNKSKDESKTTKTRKDNYDIKKPDESLTLQEKRILEYLKKGYYYSYMCKKENLILKELMKKIKSLKDRKYITQTIINEARNQRREYYMNTIENLLKSGLKPHAIYKEINKDCEEITDSGIYKLTQKLIISGRITKEEINNAREIRENLIDSKVSPLVKKGYTIKEIFETDRKTFLEEGQVRESRKRVISIENITKEQLKIWREQRKKEKQQEIYLQDEKIMWKYVANYGYEDDEIASILDYSLKYVKERRVAYQKSHSISSKRYLLIKERGKIKKQLREEKELEVQKNKVSKFLEVKALYQKEYRDFFPKLRTKKRYFNLFREITDLGIYEFTKEDVDILNYIVLYEEEFLTDDNVKYVMEKYIMINLEDDAIRLLNNYINNEIKPKLGEKRPDVYFILQKIKQGIN